jgi:hypothetical protein
MALAFGPRLHVQTHFWEILVVIIRPAGEGGTHNFVIPGKCYWSAAMEACFF